MKKGIIFLTLMLVLVLGASLVSAQGGLPGSGWKSGQQIQNIGSSDATIQFTAYNQTGTSFDCGSDVVAPGASFNVATDRDCPVSAGFEGSAVVSADQPIAAIVNVNNKGTGNAAGQYRGTDGADVSTTISFPLMKSDFNGRTSTFYIQNAGSGIADLTATFTLRASDGGGTFTKDYLNVPANAMVVITPADASVTTGTVGSLSVTGDQPLAGTALEHESSAAVAQNLQASRAFTPNDYDTKLYCPLVRYNHTGKNQTTGVQVQNVGAGTETVTITYSNGITNTASVDAGASYTFPTRLDLADGELASAVISSGDNIVAVVNDKGINTSNPQRVTTYACFPDKSATTTINIPLAKELLGVNQTGIQVQNVGTSDATFTATYKNSSGQVVVENTTPVAPGASFTFNRINTEPSTITVVSGDATSLLGTNNGVVITSLQRIVAIANESTISGSTIQDTKNYEGFNK